MKSGYLSEIFVSFQGEGAHVGRRHLFVRLAGCNLRCRYCDTPHSLERTPTYTIYDDAEPAEIRDNPISPMGLASLLKALTTRVTPLDAIALTGGEPLTQSEFLAAVLEAGRFSVPVLLETNAVLPRRLSDVLALVDIISMDIKLPSNSGEGAFWQEHQEFLELAQAKDLYAKILVDEATSDDDMSRAASLLASIRSNLPTFLQPIIDETGQVQIGASRLATLYALARRHIESVRVLPQTHKLLGIR